MSHQAPLFSSSQLKVVASVCRHPRSGPSAERGDEAPHLALLHRGSMSYHVGRRTWFGDVCTALLHRGDVGYRIGHPGKDGDDATLIELSPALADELFASAETAPELRLEPRAQLLHARVRAALAVRRGDALEREELVMELLHCVAVPRAPALRPARGIAQKRPVSRVRELLAASLSANLTIEELSTAAGCSPFHLMRLFRSETGRSLRAYRRELRVATALQRLVEGERDLSRLAQDLGFSHHSHLTETFRRVLGTTPSTIRSALVAPGSSTSAGAGRG